MAEPTSGAAPPSGGWAVPDSAAPDDASAGPASLLVADDATALGGGRPAPSSPPVPVPLRPMAHLERIDGGLRVLRLAPATVLAVTACTVVPVQLLGALVPDDPARPAEPALVAWLGRGAAIALLEDADRLPLGLALVALESIALSVASAAIGLLVLGWYQGRRPATPEILRAGALGLPALVGAWIAVHLAESVAGLFLLVPALVPMALFAVVAPVVGVEGAGPAGALRRSASLTRRRFPDALGAVVSIAVVDLVLRGALVAPTLLWTAFGLPADRVVAAAFGVAARLVTVPMVAGAVALLYVDLRARVEGLDLELAADELWPDAR